MTPAERFKKMLLVGANASPFAAALVVAMDGRTIDVPGCLIESGTNAAKLEEFDIEHVRTISAHIPKLRAGAATPTLTLPRMPIIAKDALRYQGRVYKITAVEGADDVSPVWVVEGSAPL